MKTNKIFYGKQSIDSNDIREVTKSLKNQLITSGEYVKKFENLCTKKLRSKFAFSCNSGTSAIYLAYLAINLQKDDVVVMPSVNFIAAANIARSLQAKVYFADVNYKTGQITPETISACIKFNKIKKVKVLITMYMGGYPRSVKQFHDLKKSLKCYLIEDACHAFGSSYKLENIKYMIGSCSHSDVSTFSFHPLKSITTGEGGLITTNNKLLAERIKLFRSHGINKSNLHWKYSVDSVGYNFRLSDINCSLGFSQLKKIEKFLEKRKKIFNIYKKEFKSSKIIEIIEPEKNTNSAYHLVIALINFNKLKTTKDKFLQKLIQKKIYCQYHYTPIFYFKKFLLKNKMQFKNSKQYYKDAVSLPIYYDLKLKDANKIIKEIKKVLEIKT